MCATAAGCVFGGPMATMGFGNVWDGGAGIYNHFTGNDSYNYNPVKNAFSAVFGGYASTAYSGADLVFSTGAGFVKVPMKMLASDGFGKASLFGVTVRNFDNNKFLPFTNVSLPYGTALAFYLGGVANKSFEFYKEASSEK